MRRRRQQTHGSGKKWKAAVILLCALSVGGFAAFRVYEIRGRDSTPPVIAFEAETIRVSVTDSRETLLEGVTAMDEKDGDVTDSLVIQSLSEMAQDGTRIIRYASSDKSGNVGYGQRVLEYTDYQKPRFQLTGPLHFPMGRSFQICQNIQAESVLDGDLTSHIKYTTDKAVTSSSSGEYVIEYRVTDSAGVTSYLRTELQIYDPSEYSLEVSLSSYLVYLPLGQSFDPEDYISGEIQEGEVTVESHVDTSQAGIYQVDYTVTDGDRRGQNRLIVAVGQ